MTDRGQTPGPGAHGIYGRLAILAAVLIAVILAARVSGLSSSLTADGVRRAVQDAGIWGMALFTLFVVIGIFCHIPGIVFVAAGTAVYGKYWGGTISYLAGILAISVSFLIVRAIGGTPLKSPRHPFMARMMARMDAQPIATVALLRVVFFMSPPLNYALGLSGIGLREYVVGSALGLMVPLIGVVAGVDWLMR